MHNNIPSYTYTISSAVSPASEISRKPDRRWVICVSELVGDKRGRTGRSILGEGRRARMSRTIVTYKSLLAFIDIKSSGSDSSLDLLFPQYSANRYTLSVISNKSKRVIQLIGEWDSGAYGLIHTITVPSQAAI